MKSKKILAAVLTGLFLSTSVVLAGCKPAETKNPEPTKQEQIDADQTLNIVGYEWSSLDPSVVGDADSFTTFSNVYEGLVREVTENGVVKVVNAGAKEIKKSADGLIYTITLRDGVQWSDGKAVSAKDYEYGWKRLSDPKIGQDYLHFLADELKVKGAAEYNDGKGSADAVGVKATDEKTLVITLTQQVPYFESALAFKCLVPQREDIVKALGDQYGVDYKKMVYNGPFVISDYQKGSKIVYTKNEKYWDAANVKLKTANAHIITEPTTVVKMFEGKQLDMAGASGDDLNKLKKAAEAGTYDYITGSDPSVSYFIFNTKTKALTNAKVRRALSLGFDRQAQLDTIYKRYIPAFGMVPGQMAVGDKDYRKTVAEPLKALYGKEDAKKLLDEGLKELGMTAADVNLKLLLSKASSTTTAQAAFAQAAWQKLGIKITVQHAVDSPSYFKSREKGEFDICSGGWGADYNDIASFFTLFMTTNNNNNGKYSNKKYDDLVNQANATMDATKRLDLFKQAEQLLVVDDAAVAPYLYRDVHSFRQKYLKGMYLPLFGGYFDLKNVYLSGKK